VVSESERLSCRQVAAGPVPQGRPKIDDMGIGG
jgi:hypothetical protein